MNFYEHPRGRRSDTLPVRDRRAMNPATPVSFEGLEIGEEVIAKPLTYTASPQRRVSE